MLPTLFTRRRIPGNVWPAAYSPLGRMLDLVDGIENSTCMRGFDVDVREDESGYVIEADLPGLEQDQVSVTVEDGVLRVTARQASDHEEKREGYHLRERRSGTVSRAFSLPEDVNGDAIHADLKAGVLRVTLPKREEAQPKTIKVEVN